MNKNLLGMKDFLKENNENPFEIHLVLFSHHEKKISDLFIENIILIIKLRVLVLK